jgi:ferredoxin
VTRIVVDHERCELNAVCVHQAPSVFAIGDDDRVHTIGDDATLAAAAAAACPTGAIRVEAD